MIKSQKRIKELELLLNNSNKIIVSQTIESLRNEEPFEGVIGLLTSLFDKSDDWSIKKAIENFMNDLKDKSVKPELIAIIQKKWKDDTMCMLVSACWQSGMDFSEYTDNFFEIFLKADYATAIECITVISESIEKISREKKVKLIGILKESPILNVDDRSALIPELISILEN
jgi:hypothetical protein